MCYAGAMAETIGQRELRNDNAEIIRRVLVGESFVITRNGVPVADLIPHQHAREPEPWPTLGEVQARFRQMAPVDSEAWKRDIAEADVIFGPDDPFEDPWERRRSGK
jgi:prevent-host-death family protein